MDNAWTLQTTLLTGFMDELISIGAAQKLVEDFLTATVTEIDYTQVLPKHLKSFMRQFAVRQSFVRQLELCAFFIIQTFQDGRPHLTGCTGEPGSQLSQPQPCS